jgi:hypothetical protein
MEKQIKEQRVKIDGLAALVKDLKPLPEENYLKKDTESAKYAHYNSKEIDECIDCLLLSKAWLGKTLEYIGTESPYKSDYKTKEDIVPTTDVNFAPEMLAGYEENTPHIEKVQYLRAEIEKLVNFVLNLDLSKIEKNITPDEWLETKEVKQIMHTRNKSKEYLIEAKFWLGFEISRIRESK